MFLFSVLLKFCTTKKLFTYFHQRYNEEQINFLNQLIKTRGKLRNLKSSVSFLKSCLLKKVIPRYIHNRIVKSRLNHSPALERAFIKDEIEKKKCLIERLYSNRLWLWKRTKSFLSFFDFIRFSRYLANIDEHKCKLNNNRNSRNLNLLIHKRFGNNCSDKKKNIINLSNYKLTESEEFILSHGLNFSIPPKKLNREEIFAEFEILMSQLQHHKPTSKEKNAALKARLSDLAHMYCGSSINTNDFLLHKECFQTIKALKNNNNIIITKPDKGSGAVLLDKDDYNLKMEKILSDTTKFTKIGPCSINDNTAKIESRIQRRLLELYKDDILPRSLYDFIRPTGSQRPRMYGLPKTHKVGIPVRPILSMINSAQHNLSHYLTTVLEPVLEIFATNNIKDSFTFAQEVKKFAINSDRSFLCSFDICSLFTNVPLTETIQICSDTLYTNDSIRPPFPKEVFKELMEIATTSAEFSFNNVMYKQIDGVAMGSPLGPILANIFVGYNEKILFQNIQKPQMYYRYVDDTFAIFTSEDKCNTFFQKLNTLHPSLKFTLEKETNGSISFLDVKVEKDNNCFITSIYRKPTFTGQYINWASYCPLQRKINLILALVHRALVICSKAKLNEELQFIKSIFEDNGYPESLVKSVINRKINQFNSIKTFGPKRCPVYLKLPWIGNTSDRIGKQISRSIQNTFYSVQPRLVFNSRPIFSCANKDALPTTDNSNVIYEFKCHCDSRYVGRTSQRLMERIKQHVPKSIRNPEVPTKIQPHRQCKISSTQYNNCESAIGNHLLNNKNCSMNYNDQRFRIIAKGRSAFHLSILEACFIKSTSPNLCRQKEYLYNLKIMG